MRKAIHTVVLLIASASVAQAVTVTTVKCGPPTATPCPIIKAPEIDSRTGLEAVMLLVGGIAVLRGRQIKST
jgi:hypothetical protein